VRWKPVSWCSGLAKMAARWPRADAFAAAIIIDEAASGRGVPL
jgi:hypothetical protein